MRLEIPYDQVHLTHGLGSRGLLVGVGTNAKAWVVAYANRTLTYAKHGWSQTQPHTPRTDFILSCGWGGGACGAEIWGGPVRVWVCVSEGLGVL